jgi:hypothetical protein
VDLLGNLREEGGDEKAARGEGLLRAERGNAPAVLLAGLPAPMKRRSLCEQRAARNF